MLTVRLLLCGLFCFQGGFGGDRGGRGGGGAGRGGFTPNKARGGMVSARTQQTERTGDCDWRRALVGLFDLLWFASWLMICMSSLCSSFLCVQGGFAGKKVSFD